MIEEKSKVEFNYIKPQGKFRRGSIMYRIQDIVKYKDSHIENVVTKLFDFSGRLFCQIEYDECRNLSKITFSSKSEQVEIIDIKITSFNILDFRKIEFNNIKLTFDSDDKIKKFFNIFSEQDNDKTTHLKSITSFIGCDFKFMDNYKIHKIKFDSLSFTDCDFINNILFVDCVFKELKIDYINKKLSKTKYIKFDKCTHDKLPNILGIKDNISEISFLNNNFASDIDFDNSEILDYKIKVIFNGSEFHENIIFNNKHMVSTIYKNENVKTRLFYSNIEFMSVKFKQNINLAGVTFFNQVDFSNSEFYGDLDFGYYNFDKNIEKPISFLHCKFYNNIYISCKDSVDVGMSFDFADFFSVARFDKSNFNKRFSVQHSTFHKEVYFDKSVFRDLAILANTTFFEKVYFIETKFLNDVIFDNTTFLKNVDFYKGVFDNHASFKSTDFQSFINLNSTKFKNVPILGAALIYPETPINIVYVDIEKNKIDEIDNSLKIDKNKPNNISQIFYLYQDRLSILTNMRETCRIFKDLLLNSNNHISAVSFKKTELYINELEYIYKDNPKLNSFDDKAENISSLKLRDKIDWWFLKLNRTTSDHHTDFLKILLFTLSVISGYFIANLYNELFVYDDKFFYILPSFVFLAFLSGIFIVSKKAKKIACSWYLMSVVGLCGIFYSPSIITPFLGAFSEGARNHYLYKAIDELDSQKALELSKQILAKEPTSELNAKKTLKDYKDELKSSKLLNESPELKRAVAIDGGVSRLNIAYYLVFAFCIFALQKTMRKNSIIPS